MKYFGDVVLSGGAELKNAVIERLTTAQIAALAGDELVVGRIVFDTTENGYKFYAGSVAGWTAFSSSAELAELVGRVDNIATASGGIYDEDGEFDANVFDGFGNVDDTVTDLVEVLAQLDTAITNASDLDTLGELTDVTLTTPEDSDLLAYNGTTSEWENVAPSWLPLAGGTVTGNIELSNNKITGLALAENAGDAVNLSTMEDYVTNAVQGAIAGLSWKMPVRAMSNANVDLTGGSGALTIDSVALAEGDRVLLAGQTLPEENGIYVYQDDYSLERADDVDVAAEFVSVAVFVSEGTQFQDTGWTCINNDGFTVGTDPITFVQFNGAAGIIAGVGLDKTGNTLKVKLGAGIKNLPEGEVGLHVSATGGLWLTEEGVASTGTDAEVGIKLDGQSLSLGADGIKVNAANIVGDAFSVTNNVIDIKVDSATIEVDDTSGELQVADGGITNAKLTNAGIVFSDGTNDTGSIDLGETITVTGGTGISVTAEVDDLTGDASLTVGLDASINDLYDVDITGANVGYVLAMGASGFVARKMHYVYDGTGELAEAATHYVNHGIGQKYCQVTVVDEADNVIIPNNIKFVDDGALVVDFSVAIKCRIIVSGIAIPSIPQP